jgi:hypothetical protein
MIKKGLLLLLALVAIGGGYWYWRNRPVGPLPDAGVPIYPGARNINADTFSARLSPRDRSRLVKVVIYESDDPAEKVIAFYREKLTAGKTQIFESKRRGLPSAAIRTEINGVPKLMMITTGEETAKTEISIGNITEKEPGK